MTDILRRNFGWLWTAGATTLLLAVGGLLFQVRTISQNVDELRLHGSPVLKARLDVLESLSLGQQRQMDVFTLDVKVELREIRRILEESAKHEKKTP
jgi:hypothetical protein